MTTARPARSEKSSPSLTLPLSSRHNRWLRSHGICQPGCNPVKTLHGGLYGVLALGYLQHSTATQGTARWQHGDLAGAPRTQHLQRVCPSL